MTYNRLARVIATDSALALLASLREKHGPLLLFQSGGCTDDSHPLCYSLSEFCAGNADIYLGNLDGTPVYVGQDHCEYWTHAQLIIDVAHGACTMDSLEIGTGKRFLTRSRLFSDDENKLFEHPVSSCQ
jgi:uncharacterized protein (DUF779 family)